MWERKSIITRFLGDTTQYWYFKFHKQKLKISCGQNNFWFMFKIADTLNGKWKDILITSISLLIVSTLSIVIIFLVFNTVLSLFEILIMHLKY